MLKMVRFRTLLRVDSAAGLTVGILMLVLGRWVAPIYELPGALYDTVALANVSYGLFSLGLYLLREPSRPLRWLLVIANASWSLISAVCILLTLGEASIFGLAHLALEGIFVLSLALAEWRAGLSQQPV